MKILLDTCVFIWAILEPVKLSKSAKEIFTSPNNDIFLSTISFWEIITKNRLGKLPLPEPPKQFLQKHRKKHLISALSLEEDAVLHLYDLPFYHKDPFDRMIICQSIEYGMAILTPDSLITQYPVRTIW